MTRGSSGLLLRLEMPVANMHVNLMGIRKGNVLLHNTKKEAIIAFRGSAYKCILDGYRMVRDSLLGYWCSEIIYAYLFLRISMWPHTRCKNFGSRASINVIGGNKIVSIHQKCPRRRLPGVVLVVESQSPKRPEDLPTPARQPPSRLKWGRGRGR